LIQRQKARWHAAEIAVLAAIDAADPCDTGLSKHEVGCVLRVWS
jgi:hypothetical protein